MKNLTTISIAILALLIIAGSGTTHDYLPAPPQSQAVLLQGGDLHTAVTAVKKRTDILFENGRITRIGRDLMPPEGTTIIDVSGQQVYPGLINPNTSLGLVEIGAVHATRDASEVGSINPDVQSHIAYNPDSEIIPTVRSNGITTALIVPSGGLISGRSSLLNLDGWTKEDAAEKINAGLHVRWPSMRVSTSWWERRTPEKQKEAARKNLTKLFDAFDDAHAYYLLKQAEPKTKVDSRWEAMLPVFAGDLSLFIHAGDVRQIEQAVEFCVERKLKMILVGGRESWKRAELLKKHSIPVVLGRVKAYPSGNDVPYDQPYTVPKQLADAGVTFCLSTGSATRARDLPFQAGQAIGFGLSPDDALRSVTLNAAEILGVDADLGSLEVGKKATIVISSGDIFDHITHDVTHMFIEGRQVNLDNKHKELYRKYQAK